MKQPYQIENQTSPATYELAFFEPKGATQKQPIVLQDSAGALPPAALSDPHDDSDCACA